MNKLHSTAQCSVYILFWQLYILFILQQNHEDLLFYNSIRWKYYFLQCLLNYIYTQLFILYMAKHNVIISDITRAVIWSWNWVQATSTPTARGQIIYWSYLVCLGQISNKSTFTLDTHYNILSSSYSLPLLGNTLMKINSSPWFYHVYRVQQTLCSNARRKILCSEGKTKKIAYKYTKIVGSYKNICCLIQNVFS